MGSVTPLPKHAPPVNIAFQRAEMSSILDVYGRLVMAGEARDYAVGMYRDQAVFAIYSRHAERPTWRVVKTPALAQAQGAYAVHGSQDQILKRGRDLHQVLKVFETRRLAIVS